MRRTLDEDRVSSQSIMGEIIDLSVMWHEDLYVSYPRVASTFFRTLNCLTVHNIQAENMGGLS